MEKSGKKKEEILTNICFFKKALMNNYTKTDSTEQ